MVEQYEGVTRGLSRLNTLWLALSVGTVLALGLFIATLILIIGSDYSSPHMSLLSQYLPGYTVTFGGAFIGAFWAFLLGMVMTIPGGLFYYRYTLNRVAVHSHMSREDAEAHFGEDVIRIDLVSFPVAAGLTCGVTILVATALLLLNHTPGEQLGPHLSLLGEILPGYSVSWGGSMIGFAYFSAIGGLSAVCIGWLYNRMVITRDKR
ncbi:MAG: hypothetical protein ACYTG5_21985 [Planctomycetota bacterium]|jgi:hypothetical protein